MTDHATTDGTREHGRPDRRAGHVRHGRQDDGGHPGTAGPPDRGAAAVEFALVMVPVLLILFGIISYGFLLGFRQSVSQAAAEAARAAAVAPLGADREAIAERAVADVMGVACGSTYLTCDFPPVACVPDCFGVRVTYAYTADPSKPVFPGSSLAVPDTLTYTAVSRTS